MSNPDGQAAVMTAQLERWASWSRHWAEGCNVAQLSVAVTSLHRLPGHSWFPCHSRCGGLVVGHFFLVTPLIGCLVLRGTTHVQHVLLQPVPRSGSAMHSGGRAPGLAPSGVPRQRFGGLAFPALRRGRQGTHTGRRGRGT